MSWEFLSERHHMLGTLPFSIVGGKGECVRQPHSYVKGSGEDCHFQLKMAALLEVISGWFALVVLMVSPCHDKLLQPLTPL